MGNNNCFIIHPRLKKETYTRAVENALEEAQGLAEAISLNVVDVTSFMLGKIKPSTYIGGGQIELIKEKMEELGEPEVLIFDGNLSPSQQRNLETALDLKVIDRTGLILEIFGKRAKTKEGRAQVQLASLSYQRSRLVRSWTHLERQKGGAGFLGGPGERQIELDRRMIDEQIGRIKKELEKIKQTRELQRGKRKRVPWPIVALVGYTNAGKSTLFNILTKADVMAKDMLFATLDPTMRAIKLPSGKKVILADTVGFISELPHQLVEAFKATLEEVMQADLLLHVIDINDDDFEDYKANVLEVLESLGIDDIEQDRRLIDVYNKIDLLDHEEQQYLLNKLALDSNNKAVAISAYKEMYLLQLLDIIDSRLSEGEEAFDIHLKAEQSRFIAWLHENARITHEYYLDDGRVEVQGMIEPEKASRFATMLKASHGDIPPSFQKIIKQHFEPL
ncbi:MAG: GTPase HflX [Alphaproteobacteria bacterium]